MVRKILSNQSYFRKLSFTFHLIHLAFNFSIVAANIELPIHETARHQADRAVCGHAGISELSLPHRIARYASLSYKSVGENMRYAFGNSFSMLSGFFSLTARQSKHNRSASQANASNMAFPLFSLALQCGRR